MTKKKDDDVEIYDESTHDMSAPHSPEKGFAGFKIKSASKVQHIECACGYSGMTHTGSCPNCGAKQVMSDSELKEHDQTQKDFSEKQKAHSAR